MNRRLFYAITVCIAITTNAHAQNEHRMTIGDMFGLIDQHNRTIRAGKTAVAAADEGVRAARSQRLPDVGAQVSASYIGNAVLTDRDFAYVHGLHSPHFGNQLVVDARQTVYAGGAIDAGIRLAQLGADQARAELALNLQNQRFIALGQYLDLMKTANRERVVENNIALTQKLIDNITEKQQQGVALKNDITRYELQMERLRLSLTQLHNSRRILNHQLCNTLGLPIDYAIEPADDACSALYGKDGEAYWQTAAVAASPKLVMVGVGEQMARQQERIAKSELLPKVALVAQNNFNGPITFELPPIDKNLNYWFVGVGVSYNFSALWKNKSKVRKARLATATAQDRLTEARKGVSDGVHAAFVDFGTARTQLATREKSLQLACENYDVVSRRYQNGLAIVTDLTDAANMRLDAELQLANARINLVYAYYNLCFVANKQHA